MNPEYERWICREYPTKEYARNKCQEATQEMIESFPELIRVRGHMNLIEHWWCKTLEGEIVDPTIMQFDFLNKQMNYVEHREGVDPEPLGKCMNCGSYCWENDKNGMPIKGASSYSCSEFCDEEIRMEFAS